MIPHHARFNHICTHEHTSNQLQYIITFDASNHTTTHGQYNCIHCNTLEVSFKASTHKHKEDQRKTTASVDSGALPPPQEVWSLAIGTVEGNTPSTSIGTSSRVLHYFMALHITPQGLHLTIVTTHTQHLHLYVSHTQLHTT